MTPVVVELAEQFPCPACGTSNLLAAEDVYTYLWDLKVPCDRCGEQIDLWTSLSRYLASSNRPEPALALVGASVPFFTVPVVFDQDTTISFGAHGVPKDADIMAVFTKPIVTPSRTVSPPIDLPLRLPSPASHELRLRAHKVPGEHSGKLQITVVWMPQGEHTAQRQLVDATSHFVAGRLAEIIIPANSAVESVVTPLVVGCLERFVSRDRVESFISEATYSHQLNVLLPVLAKLIALPPLPDVVRGALNRLNKLRNDKAHRGHLATALTKAEAAELLTSAFLGVSYAAMSRPVLVEGTAPRRPHRQATSRRRVE